MKAVDTVLGWEHESKENVDRIMSDEVYREVDGGALVPRGMNAYAAKQIALAKENGRKPRNRRDQVQEAVNRALAPPKGKGWPPRRASC